MRSAANRRTRDGRLLGAHQAVTVEEILRAYTVGSALAFGIDDQVGPSLAASGPTSSPCLPTRPPATPAGSATSP
jgi:hypothetical protein